MEESAVEVDESLKTKADGRKTPWFRKRIAELEKQLEEKKDDESWAEGFVACMHQFQLLNKSARKQILSQLKEHGRGYAKKLRAGRFRGVSF